jgi:hypothetical protein
MCRKGSIRAALTPRFLSHSTDFQQEVESLQVEYQSVVDALPGRDVAI